LNVIELDAAEPVDEFEARRRGEAVVARRASGCARRIDRVMTVATLESVKPSFALKVKLSTR